MNANAQTCDVRDCGLPAVTLIANDAPLLSPDYREWYACHWHERNTTMPAAALALPLRRPDGEVTA